LGVYSIALQAVESMWLVPAAIATAVTAPVVAAPDDRHAAGLIARSAIRALGLATLIAGAVGAIAPFLIPAAFGRQFRGAVVPFELLLPGVVLYAPPVSPAGDKSGLSLAVPAALKSSRAGRKIRPQLRLKEAKDG